MHTCPTCGRDCDCNGDINDVSVYTRQWAEQHCECCYDGADLAPDGLPLDEEENNQNAMPRRQGPDGENEIDRAIGS